MNTQKLNEAIADHLKKPHGWYCPHCAEYVPCETVTYDETHQVCGYDVQNREANYTDSLDAIHEAVKGLTDEEYDRYNMWLEKICTDAPFEGHFIRTVHEGTALQRAIAYAKTKGLNYE